MESGLHHLCLLPLQPAMCGAVVMRPVRGCAGPNKGGSDNDMPLMPPRPCIIHSLLLSPRMEQRRLPPAKHTQPKEFTRNPPTRTPPLRQDREGPAIIPLHQPARFLRPKTSKSMRAPYHHHPASSVPRRVSSSSTSPRARLLVLLAIVAVVGLVYKATTSAPSPSTSSLLQVCLSYTASLHPLPLPLLLPPPLLNLGLLARRSTSSSSSSSFPD